MEFPHVSTMTVGQSWSNIESFNVFQPVRNLSVGISLQGADDIVMVDVDGIKQISDQVFLGGTSQWHIMSEVKQNNMSRHAKTSEQGTEI